jgi:two-component system, LytTR family, response regulator
MKYHAMIVDDVYAVDALKDILLRVYPEINICCTTNSIHEAALAIETHQPEIFFLNISFSGIFDLIFSPSFTTEKRIIVFTCNPDECFQKNLLANAMIFLEKPFSKKSVSEALLKAIRHYETILTNPDTENIYTQSLVNLCHQLENPLAFEKITIPVRFGFKIVKLSELIYLHSDENYTILYLTESRVVVANLQIDRFQQYLPKETFIKINNFTIINLSFLKMRYGHAGKTLLMSDGTVLSVSKSRLTELDKKLALLSHKPYTS